MGTSTVTGGGPNPSPRKNGFPPEIIDIIGPALQLGGLAGMSGVIIGGFAGVVVSNTPMLFALASGVQWFTLGSTFWTARGCLLSSWDGGKITPREKVSVSAFSGGIAGTMGGFLRGRKNIVPGAIIFTAIGGIGQYVYNAMDARKTLAAENASVGQEKYSWMNSKWSPVKQLSDAEYGDMMREKLLRVNAEIALIDESIEALQSEKREMPGSTPRPNGTNDSR
ncbi:uncharacterized protein BP5553_04082 [Venustampulla echinocandica]|uniref:Uncharacterized protein n=1 Tax=Venustampulla echinocandica TaxID=2656787 RepID=A0A370TW47_9HELO|nr:uncharacterized protein BP5553_04082 [Venustampulla echinocandica]RDL39742.1 hypothetical protein BP5553_04082 [Venustampulla echinocandica]